MRAHRGPDYRVHLRIRGLARVFSLFRADRARARGDNVGDRGRTQTAFTDNEINVLASNNVYRSPDSGARATTIRSEWYHSFVHAS